MDSSTKSPPLKISESPKDENQNPNFRSPSLKPSKSPSIKSAKKNLKSAVKNPNPNPNPLFSPKNKIHERKFVVAKRNLKRGKENSLKVECNCKERVGNKCLCLAYERLRASQEEFFKPRDENKTDVYETSGNNPDEELGFVEMGSLKNKDGSGKVMSLVKAFERLKTESPDSNGRELKGSVNSKLQIKVPDTQMYSNEFSFGSSIGSSSLDSSQRSFTFSSMGSYVGRRSRRNSSEMSGTFGRRRWRKQQQQLKATRQQPFKLLTEQRGRTKEEEFSKKLQEMMVEEQKQRIPIAQGLPWTTDEPEHLVKPPVKEITTPVDLVLHSDVRAADRSEFDQQLAEKEALIEQIRMERERQQKIAEEEEIRRLRKVLIPKAQPMPYFDRPFIPKRSEKHPTIPIEPVFHIPQHKKTKSCPSWNDFSSYQQ